MMTRTHEILSRALPLAVAPLLLVSSGLAAPRLDVAGDLKNPRIISHHFTTTLSGARRVRSVKDISKGRFLVVKVSADVSAKTTLFNTDFVLVYRHLSGTEDRARCEGLSGCKGDGANEYEYFRLSDYARIQLTPKTRSFGLAFYVESDVKSVQIYRVGSAEPLGLTIGTERKISVYLTTNRSDDSLQKAQASLAAGGYHIASSTGLTKEATGITIQYAEKAEAAAREISQRLMLKFGVAPTVKKAEQKLATEVDVLIWLGK